MKLSTLNQAGWPGNLAAIISGLLLPFALAPYDIWPLAIFSPLLILFLVQNLNPTKSALRGWFYGVGVFGMGVPWVYVSMHDYANTPAPLAILLTGLFAAGLALFFCLQLYIFGRFIQKHKYANLIGFPALWLLFEWLRSWLFTGFPWLYLGDSLLDTWLASLAPVIGVYGLGLILTLSASFIYQQVKDKKLQPVLITLMVLPWFAGFLLQNYQWTQTYQSLKVAAVQGNIPQEKKWDQDMIYPTLERYSAQSAAHWDADLILWPETAITVLLHQAEDYLDYLGKEAVKTNTTLVTGIPYMYPADHEDAGRYHNSVISIGTGEGIYHKQQLVPFGEYVPMEKLIRGLIEFFNLPMSSFLRGPSNQTLLKANAHNKDDDKDTEYLIAPFICYEIVYPQLVSKMSREADLLVTISNDAWFGTSNGPLQHLASARMRALENGRYLLRATNTGITTLINPQGKIVKSLPQFRMGTLSANAQLTRGLTPFNRFGVWPMVILAFILLGFCCWNSLPFNRLGKFKSQATAE